MFQDERFEIEELINDLEHRNAMRYLDEFDRKVYEYIIYVDVEMAKSAKDFGEYLEMDKQKTPIERAAEHFNMNPFEIKNIARRVIEQLDELTKKNG
ncbi:hypothetical protein LGQ02_02770 [Bacillus shivajii]|uniref:hypothetical protein n=1 Tax=Bacillus shivajii TaxID=1983719 RepID=UPI001CFBD513|nr:hypothetical protein [Bacillus shivajii]UCZ53727.1 hypothetical protein LGQ02_02770 [Bacillus shivajii]